MKRTHEYKWMVIAKNETGTNEITGAKHNPRIIEYHATTTLKATTDEVPWCASFVNWVMKQAGLKITGSASARSWCKYGEEVEPQYGCIVVTSRGDNPQAGHVGFLVRVSADRVWLLGGNQSNTVKISSFPRSRVLNYRMPIGWKDMQMKLADAKIA
jgi:uncharacterized protein (TIGR02594 family)